MGSQQSQTDEVSEELKEKLAEQYPGLTLEEALQHQEGLYQSLQTNSGKRAPRSSDDEQHSNRGQESSSREESSLSESTDDHESQLALDEALARSLQDLEGGIDDVYISEPVPSGARNAENASAPSSATGGNQVLNQDNIDPDRMTHEELQSLEEAIGTEPRGLSSDDISCLPSFKYKTGGMFSKKSKTEGCVICCMEYKNKEFVTALPCCHQYHTKCINHWLKDNKNCPLCLLEVKVSS